MMSIKRPRTNSQSESFSKLTRLQQQQNINLICTLPPTCLNSPTLLFSSSDLESHYANFHAHVCEQPSCSCVFPDQRLLELHQTECHDPIAALRRDRGEKIFACHLSSCPRLFRTPKTRRLHLIQAHAFPKQFFFAVTNKGVGGLLKRWGEGASMIRGEWSPRDRNQDSNDTDRDSDGESDQDMSDPPIPTENSTPLDALTSSMNSLSLVPPSIRFGRGGKNGGFAHRGGYSAHSAPIDPQRHPVSITTTHDLDHHHIPHLDQSSPIIPVVDDRDSPSDPLPATTLVKPDVPTLTPAQRARGHPRGRGRRFASVRGGGGLRPVGGGRGGSVPAVGAGRGDGPLLGGAVRGGRGAIARGGPGVGRGRRGSGSVRA